MEITSDTDGSGTIDDGEKKLYLIQTNAFQSFYIAPQSNNKITTNNILGDYMLWYFLNAGEVNGTQYYYIVNNSTGKYIYNSNGNGRLIDLISSTDFAALSDANKEKCKFKFVLDESNETTGFYNIDVKASQTYYGLNKQSGSQSNDNPIRLTNDQYIHQFNSKWKFIPYNGTFTWPDPPFTPSTDSEKYYYEILNIQKNKYYASTDGTPDKVTFTEQATERRAWYFKEASSDDTWYKYYYIINPSTGGKYMHYDGTADNTSDQTNAVSVKAYDSNDEDRYQFVVVRAARGDFENNKDTRVECYAIIPKLLIDNLWTSNSLGLADGSQTEGANMGIINSRGATSGAHWAFKSTEIPTGCGNPVITFDRTTGKATISTTTSWPSIYYTTDGTTTPSSSNGTEYGGPFDLTEQTTIKAIVTKDGYTDSQVETKTIYKVATPTIQNETGSHRISITTTTPGATIYYTIDGTTPTTSSTLYTGSSEDLGGKPINAIAVKDGMINSDIGQGEIDIRCATPVISFNNATSMVTITCATEGSTIYYTTNGSDPTASSTLYNDTPFSVSSPTTVKAIATHATKLSSSVAELAISQVATPVFTIGESSVTITCATAGASIYYTDDGTTTPTTSSTPYTTPLTDVAGKTIKAIAVKGGYIDSEVATSATILFACATPVIKKTSQNSFTITCSNPATGVTIYYTTNGSTPTTSSSSIASGEKVTGVTFPCTVKAFATATNYSPSEVTEKTISNGLGGSGTADNPYVIEFDPDFALFVDMVNDNGTTNSNYAGSAAAHYQVIDDVSASGTSAITTEFTGTFDGGLHTISGLGHALFNTVNGGTVKNIVLDNVTIGGSTTITGDTKTATGAIANIATGASRIYNCGIQATNSTVKTDEDGYTHITACSSKIDVNSDYVGGIVGFLDGTSRVVNCYSYANITKGSYVGGIVGYNNVATTSAADNLKTMVMNCMFYGEVSGSSIAPIYNGKIITNVGENTGVSNFNYFRLESAYIQNTAITKVYNCALGAETRFLQRFEFFRNLQNSHRELAAWWASTSTTPSPNVTKDEMAKWVLLPSQIGSSTPYPVLAKPGYYPSVVNLDAKNAVTGKPRNQGGRLGTLAVHIQMGSGGAVYAPPTDAAIKKEDTTLIITDKDTLHFNFNYYKVQLPYYNDVGTGNYTLGSDGNNETSSRVVTGWKIVDITGGTPGTFTKSDSWDGYNFADRNCTNKDLYSESDRVFSQGAYWDVPEGVTAITIEPYWAKAAYLADENADMVYNTDMSTSYKVPNVGGGKIYNNGSSYSIAGKSQKVYTSLSNAVNSLSITASYTVNDYAVVLVGNYHHVVAKEAAVSGSSPYTVTSVDLDGDDEPDYSLMLRNNGRNIWHPVKWDFINISGLGMAQKSTGDEATGSYNLGIVVPRGWFETTNTSLFRVTQFEYSRKSSRSIAAPYILQGGVMEQWVTGQNNVSEDPMNTTYFHLGGNVWFKEFHRGTHQDNTGSTNHTPISVTGGDFDKFYLTGLYRSDVTSYGDNAECYINGGRFGVVAGAAMEGIGKADGADDTGNITWQIQNADIKEFYGGGLNADRPVTGNISTTITGGKIDLFCGGPKFGDMSTGKTVTTTATGCEFGTFFGAGYGGSSYSRRAPRNIVNMINMPAKTGDNKTYGSWNAWVEAEYKQKSATDFPGISTRFDYQFIPNSGNADNVGRLFVEHVLFSLATTHNVTSTLTNCTITGNFYGGGSLGMVDGPVTSTLTDCTIRGNVFGAGYSASLPTVEVDSVGFRVEPYYYTELGTYRTGVKGKTTTYQWQHDDKIDIDTVNKILYTKEDLNGLGVVKGKATLTINGTTTVGESIYGGGEESVVEGNTEVTVNSGSIGVENTGTFGYRWGNVYGGGKGKIDDKTSELTVSTKDDLDAGLVKGNTTITINGGTILHNVYGGGAVGSVGTFDRDTNGMPTAFTASTGLATVIINGGTIGHDHQDTGMVFGSSRGWEGNPKGEGALAFLNQLAWVKNTNVTIGSSTSNEEDAGPTVYGSVYGGGENGHNFGNGKVTVYKGTIGYANGTWDCGNIYGAGCGTDTFERDDDGEDESKHHNPMAGIVCDSTFITVKGGHILRNIYGAGSMGSVGTYTYDAKGLPTTCAAKTGNTIINIRGGVIGTDDSSNDYGRVFGGPKGSLTETEFSASVRETLVNIDSVATVKGSVFGGGEAGIVKESVVVNMDGGEVKQDVYGGGALAHTNLANWVQNETTHEWGWHDADKKSSEFTTTVNLHGGTIGHNAYGGGLGSKAPTIEALVYGDVLIELNGTEVTGEGGTKSYPDNCVVKGVVYGSNNYNGSPKGDVTVHINKTQGWEEPKLDEDGHQVYEEDGETPAMISHDVSAGKADENVEKTNAVFELKAVYGGGNEAAYEPQEDGKEPHVIIDGCDRTSIETVYGGGNAAAVTGTHVTVNSCYEIGTVFGGGNGLDAMDDGTPNPGADVGLIKLKTGGTAYEGDATKQAYGSGNAYVELLGGTIHTAFGGSNTKGNIREKATVDLNEPDVVTCPLEIDAVYGAGNEAEQDGSSEILLGCLSYLKEIYGGSMKADINNDVNLTIQSGRFDRVFGGNNLGGCIRGSIKVNIEETGCHPIIIGQLYGGGNEAGYSVYGYKEVTENGEKVWKPRESSGDSGTGPTTAYAHPEVNVKSFTSIGEIYGGGYGTPAVMVGNPHVNVNVCEGENASKEVETRTIEGQSVSVSQHTGETKTINGTSVEIPLHKSDAIGAIGLIFGGGNAAKVVGDTYVNVGTESSVVFETAYETKEVNVTDDNGDPVYEEDGVTPKTKTVLVYENDGVTPKKKSVPVVGADIRKNIYGGGNNAEVTGNTHVQIGE